jgi:rod shape-determining protein MreD
MGDTWLIVTTFVVALFLQIVPVPQGLQWARPEWVCMVLLYWVVAAPDKVGVGVAWMLGLLIDGFEGALLGQNAFALAIVAYMAHILYQIIRMFFAWQQAFIIYILIGLDLLLCNWAQSLQGGMAGDLMFLMPALMSALLWPGMMVILRGMRRRFGMIKPI